MARAKPAKRQPAGATVALNRRARRDYEILEQYDAGLALLGSEIKSIREGKVNIAEGYARFEDGELWLYNVHIARYMPAGENHEPTRARKLLLHRRELDRLHRELEEQPRTTVVPLRLYLQRGLAKVEIGLGRGRRAYDKRQVIATRDAERTIARAMRREQR